MVDRRWISPVPLLLGLVLPSGCSGGTGADPFAPDDTTPSDTIPAATIPLDGRGGGVIAYTLQPGPGSGVHEIHAMNADGTGGRRIIDAPFGLNHHNWSPNGQKLAAVGYLADATSVHVFDADGGNLTRLTTASGVSDAEPNWSPDGSAIVFTRVYQDQGYRSEIWMMNADGSNQRWIGVEGFAARWSPDGSRLIYQSALGQLTGLQSDAADWAPRWSPDGTTIAFSSDSSGSEHWEVYLIGADGTGQRRVTFTQAPRTSINPVWRPGG